MSSVLSNESALDTPGEAVGVADDGARINSGIPRWADGAVAFIGLLVSAPIIGLCAAAIAVTSGMPVFFRQKRVGLNGELFELVKLRTMRASEGGPQITRRGDQRITWLGRFLRQSKLDELPTLWNVFRGDMGLVGPRPEVPRYVKLDDPAWQVILRIRPGLTDPVTVRLRNEEALLARVEGDTENYYVNELQPAKLKGYLEYLNNRTCRGDVRILLHTFAEIIHNRRR